MVLVRSRQNGLYHWMDNVNSLGCPHSGGRRRKAAEIDTDVFHRYSQQISGGSHLTGLP